MREEEKEDSSIIPGATIKKKTLVSFRSNKDYVFFSRGIFCGEANELTSIQGVHISKSEKETRRKVLRQSKTSPYILKNIIIHQQIICLAP